MAKVNLPPPNGYKGQKATSKKMGIVRFATDAEATAGIANDLAVTPSQLANSGGGQGDFTELTVVGPTDLNGISNINITGSAATNIGTGATGTVNIGNVTGQTNITGQTNVSGSLRALSGLSVINGNILVSTSSSKLTIQTGSIVGVSGPLVAGSLVVNVAGVTANSIIFFSTNTLGTVVRPQSYIATAKGAGTFTILSSDATDTSTVNYFIIN